ncbi:MAG: hypothetical protein JJ953_14765 [Gracilimonas sp.]|uniref:Uncharacterized protein n=1 Tax=Gracilimonas sediminicola TaxID=2952158 RepID=A0A9X2L236_9BACT|nr:MULTISPECIES: hypothetical protein [Gracilimonas]MBO6587371.1 hypothetical protein [Gracilimonas sp.]MBO6614143.1 hypothetical protein [Gracilimonas sp.]MCP9290812.1 hypothetical protein [Gracilimonas sediminicola]
MRSLPFSIENLNGGFMKVEGILRVEGENLVFEFQKKDAVVEAYQSELRTETIPLSELDMLEYKKGWFSGKLILHGKRASSFGDLPGKELTERVLKVKRKHRNVAASISSNLNLKLSEQKLNELED